MALLWYLSLFICGFCLRSVVSENGTQDRNDTLARRRFPRLKPLQLPNSDANQPANLNALLVDSLRSRRVQACEGRRVPLKCPAHTHIQVEHVFYGRLVPSTELCPPSSPKSKRKRRKKKKKKSNERRRRKETHDPLWRRRHRRQLDRRYGDEHGYLKDDEDELGLPPDWDERYEDTSCDVTNALDKVVEKCATQRKCRIQASPYFFGRDPCPSTPKYLQVAYKCKPSEFDSQTFCQGSDLTLSCRSKSKRLAVFSATYGRKAETVENNGEQFDDVAPACSAVGKPADFGCTLDVLQRIVVECQAMRKCSIPINDDIFPNPCPLGVIKHLNVVFMCVRDNVFNERALEGQIFENSFRLAELQPPPTSPPVAQPPTYIFDELPLTPRPKPKASNDGWSPAYIPPSEPDYFDKKQTTVASAATTEAAIASTKLPPHLPNAVKVAHDWMELSEYLLENKEKFGLYFMLAVCLGLILLLLACIADQVCKRMRLNKRDRRRAAMAQSPRSTSAQHEYLLAASAAAAKQLQDDMMHDSGHGSTLYDHHNPYGVVDGVSFMRMNQPTPPRVPMVQHYYS